MTLPKSYLRNKERFILSHSSMRKYLQAMILGGLRHYRDKESDCAVLTDIVVTCKERKTGQLKHIEEYIFAHANVCWVLNKQGNKVIGKDRKAEGTTLAKVIVPKVPYWEWEYTALKVAKVTAVPDHAKSARILAKNIEKKNPTIEDYDLYINELLAAKERCMRKANNGPVVLQVAR